jgi:hypothetical protein
VHKQREKDEDKFVGSDKRENVICVKEKGQLLVVIIAAYME